MEPTSARPDRTHALDGWLPRPVSGRLTVLVALGGASLLGADLARRVRRLRRVGASVPALDHDVDLAGRFPPRWLVVLGDSAAAGHGLPGPQVALPQLLGEALRAADGRATAVRSAARDGAATAEVAAQQVTAVSGAEVVVVGVGVNDALRPWRSVGEVASATRVLLEELAERAAPGASIVLLTCPDLSAAPGVPGPLRQLLGWRCRRIAAAQRSVAQARGVPVVDAARRDVRREMFGPDGFHPGALAHRRLAEQVLEVLGVGRAAP
jgi:lysophospholipase L1-like esterase